MLLGRAQPCFSLRCEIASELARCQGILGEVRLQKQTLAKALELCQSTRSTADRQARIFQFLQLYHTVSLVLHIQLTVCMHNGFRQERCAWELHFLCELATCAANDGDAAAALEFLDRTTSALEQATLDTQASPYMLCTVTLSL